MIRNKIARKLVFAGLGFLILAVVAEITLRSAGFLLTATTRIQNRIDPSDAKKLRILAIGESTTADFFANDRDGAWPRQLEKMLLEAGIPARVYNEGRVGTTTALILSRTQDFLDQYRPDIVITMMGINDTPHLRYDDGPASERVWTSISDLRLLKLFGWMRNALDASLRSCRLNNEGLEDSDAPLLRSSIELAHRLKPEETMERLRERVPDSKKLALLISSVGRELLGDLAPGQDTRDAERFLDRAFDLYPTNHRIAFLDLYAVTHSPVKRLDRCVAVSKKLLECSTDVPDDIISVVAVCVANDPEFRDLMRSKRITLNSERGSSATAFYYRKFHEMLHPRGILHVAMQYPTLPTGELKQYFYDSKGKSDPAYGDILFVENESNFAKALASRTYKDVFIDRFGGSWGHTTIYGHRLIAENVFQALLSGALKKVQGRHSVRLLRGHNCSSIVK